MKKIILVLFTLFILPLSVNAQEATEDAVRKYGITFPIAELGGCSDIAACRTFCEDPVNKAVCVGFAKAKGFYQEDQLSERQEELLTKAKAVLGCSDIASCQAVCHLEENFDKCNSFARSNGIQGGHTQDPGRQEVLTQAKAVLGCDSPAVCRAMCQQEANREKCSTFAQQAGIRGGQMRRGPGGCTSEETCKAFCTDPTNFNECSQYGQRRGENQQFSGPGGCNSEASCRAYCEQNPTQCQFMREENHDQVEACFKGGQYWYDGTCNDKPKTGYSGDPRYGTRDPRIDACFQSGKFWFDNTCNDQPYSQSDDYKRRSEEYTEYCRRNPDNCRRYDNSGPGNVEDRGQGYSIGCQQPLNGCPSGMSWDRGTCTCRPPCTSGTSWNGTYCMQDSGTTVGSGYAPSCSVPATGCGPDKTWDRGTCTCKPACGAGTSWNGTYCMQDSTSNSGGSYDPATACTQASGCTWNGSSCQCTSQSSQGSVSAEEQCRRDGKCWQDNSCRDCGGSTSSSGSTGNTSGSSGSSMEADCTSHGGHMENGTCVGAVQGATAPTPSLFSRIVDFFRNLLAL